MVLYSGPPLTPAKKRKHARPRTFHFGAPALEIVMNELRKLRMSADLLQIVPILFLGVQECRVLFSV